MFSCFPALEIYTGLKKSNSSICPSGSQQGSILLEKYKDSQKQHTPFGLSNPGFKTGSVTHYQFVKNIRSLHLNVLSGRCKRLQEAILRGPIGELHFSNV